MSKSIIKVMVVTLIIVLAVCAIDAATQVARGFTWAAPFGG